MKWEEKKTLLQGGYEDRIIDIDIVEFGNIRFYSQKLMIPHLNTYMKEIFRRSY
jgi:2-amino-4-hydroxy-6-hydroxymethyldihydropteridine diphosphokinase